MVLQETEATSSRMFKNSRAENVPDHLLSRAAPSQGDAVHSGLQKLVLLKIERTWLSFVTLQD